MPNLSPITRFLLTDHARFEMARRQVSEKDVAQVLAAPEYMELVRIGRAVYQSRSGDGNKVYLLRVFVDIDREPPEVVTVYHTSKVGKYWRSE